MTDKQQDECNAIIHNAAESAIAETKGSVQVPAWDNEKLLPIELGMIIALGKVFGISLTESSARSVIERVACSKGKYAINPIFTGVWSTAMLGFIEFSVFGYIKNRSSASEVVTAVGWTIAYNFASR